jgi:hypothetical protein
LPPPLNVEHRTSNIQRRRDGFVERGQERLNATCPAHDTPVPPDGFDNNPFDVRCSRFEVRRTGEILPENDDNTPQAGNLIVPDEPTETGNIQGAHAPRSPGRATGHDWSDVPDPDELTDWARDRLVLREPAE